MRRFLLDRYTDHSGVSGTGVVAQGVRFGNGWCALYWVGAHPSLSIHPSVESVLAIHGHGGDTMLVWLDPDPA